MNLISLNYIKECCVNLDEKIDYSKVASQAMLKNKSL